MKSFTNNTNVNLQGEELFEEIFEAFQHGVMVGIEEANYIFIKKLASLNINLTLIADLTNIPIDDVACIINDKDLDIEFPQ